MFAVFLAFVERVKALIIEVNFVMDWKV